MFRNISFNKIWFRFLTFCTVGILFKFFFDIVFSLIYRNYELLQSLQSYSWAILLALIVQEGIYKINKQVSKRFSWEKYFLKRIVFQLMLNSLYALLLVIFVRLIISFLFFEKDFIRISDEAIYLTVTMFGVILLSLIDLGIFLFSKWKTSIVEIEKYKKEKAEFHLGMLQAQLNPHFLFNSLNTLSSLIFENKEMAADFTRELADVYRYVLESRKKELVSLEEEKAFTDSLIKLYKIRFDKKLSFNIKFDNIAGYYLPPLIIQLLIENAVKHNIISQNKPLTVEIIQNGDHIIIKNNLQEKQSIGYSPEVGLDNIVSRYKYFTDKKVVIQKTEAEFIVEIPLIRVND